MKDTTKIPVVAVVGPTASGKSRLAVELALRKGVPYAIDFCNPAPDAEVSSVGQENFDWVVETSANYAIEKAQSHRDGYDNLTWGEYLRRSADGQKLY